MGPVVEDIVAIKTLKGKNPKQLVVKLHFFSE